MGIVGIAVLKGECMERLTQRNSDGTIGISECRYYNYKDFQKLAKKLADYEDLEEQGLLLKLPCKVGDTLYYPYIDDTTKEKVISKEKVTDIGLHYSVEKDGGYLSSCSEIGEIIFLTQEEAEEELKKITK